MKKEYIHPKSWNEDCIIINMICDSDGVTGDGIDADYGGVDEDGTGTPSVKEREDIDPLLVGQTDGWIGGLW